MASKEEFTQDDKLGAILLGLESLHEAHQEGKDELIEVGLAVIQIGILDLMGLPLDQEVRIKPSYRKAGQYHTRLFEQALAGSEAKDE